MSTAPQNPNEAARRSGGGMAGYARQMAIAMELPFALAGPVLVGGLIGYFLDKWWGTAPWLLLLMVGFGFFAGVRELSRRMKSLNKAVAPPAPKQTDGDGKSN